MRILLKTVLLSIILTGCAVNVKEFKEDEKDIVIEKLFKKELNEIQLTIKTKEKKVCSIFLNKRVIDLNKIVNKEFKKNIILKKNELEEDIIVRCN
jgi:hypothetical protein